MKTCVKCKNQKDFSEFGKLTVSKDGHKGTCKSCLSKSMRKYRIENSEKCKSMNRKYLSKRREANRDKYNSDMREYRAKNSERCKEVRRAHSIKNKDKIAECRRKHYEKNKDKSAERSRKYRENNPDKFKEYKRIDYARNQEIHIWRSHVSRAWKGSKTSLEIIGLSHEMAKTVYNQTMAIARKYFPSAEMHHDHMTPLSSGKTDEERRALNHFTNFVFIPATSNMSKRAKPFWEWYATLTDEKLKKCIAEQDAYNKEIQKSL